MIKTILAVTAAVVLLVGAGVLLYLFLEKPLQNEQGAGYHNLSIAFVDGSDRIAMPYVITLGKSETPYRTGTTSAGGFVLEEVPLNSGINVFAVSNRTPYRTANISIDGYRNPASLRAEIPLTKKGTLAVRHTGELQFADPIQLFIEIQGQVDLHAICLRWSGAFINVEVWNTTRIDPPERLKGKVDRCYGVWNQTEFQYGLIHRQFRPPREEDFIRAVIVDAEPAYFFETPVAETPELQDVGIADVAHEIRAS